MQTAWGHDSEKLEKGREGFRQKTILGTANALAEMYQRPGEPGEAGGVKRVAAVGVWFQTAGKGMEGLSTRSGFSGAPETLKGVKNTNGPGLNEMTVLSCGSKQLESAKKNFDKRSVSFFQRCRFPEHAERLKLNA